MKALITGIGSVLGAVLASACCIGPLLTVGLGIGGLGAATALEAYRRGPPSARADADQAYFHACVAAGQGRSRRFLKFRQVDLNQRPT